MADENSKTPPGSPGGPGGEDGPPDQPSAPETPKAGGSDAPAPPVPEVSSPIADRLRGKFPEAVLEVSSHLGQVTVLLKKEAVAEVCRFLKEDPETDLRYLSNICGVDYPERPERFEVVYHPYSIRKNHRLHLKIRVGEGKEVPSVTGVWRTAGWHEREVFDMYGVRFQGHPDLRRILMPEDWRGHPQRKDYPLEGYADAHIRYRDPDRRTYS